MNNLRLALAVAVCSFSSAAFATAFTPTTYSVYKSDGSLNTTSTTNSTAAPGGASANNYGTTFTDNNSAAYCAAGASGCATAGGWNYGNTYTYGASGGSGGPSVAITAFGTQTLSTTASIYKAYIGNYGSTYGLGVTSQSPGELNGSNDPNSASPDFQHAIDNTQAYETLKLSFTSAVTLNSLAVGFTGAEPTSGTCGPTTCSGAGSKVDGAAATVFAYTGAANSAYIDPTGYSYTQLLANGWVVAGNLNLVDYSSNSLASFATQYTSQYWMVGAYIPNSLGADPSGSLADSFKITGFSATRSVPEPGSIALFGIAGVAFAASRRRRALAA